MTKENNSKMEVEQEGGNILVLAPGQTGLGCEICVVCGDRASGICLISISKKIWEFSLIKDIFPITCIEKKSFSLILNVILFLYTMYTNIHYIAVIVMDKENDRYDILKKEINFAVRNLGRQKISFLNKKNFCDFFVQKEKRKRNSY